MADVSVTATSVAPITGSGAGVDTVIEHGIAAETITAGQSLYLNTSNQWAKADANLSAAAAAAKGIALNGAAQNQPIAVATSGTLTCGFTATVGTIYVVSATAGGIAPAADLASGWYTTIIGVGLTAGTISLPFHRSGVAVPA